MTTLRKWTLLCGIAAFMMVTTLAPVARADELRPQFQEKTAFEGNRGRGGRGHGGGRRGGGRGRGGHYRGGSGWAWAGFGAAVGVAAIAAANQPTYVYQAPAPTYYYPPATTYYVQPGYTYSQPAYVQPNYGQTYVAPCNACP